MLLDGTKGQGSVQRSQYSCQHQPAAGQGEESESEGSFLFSITFYATMNHNGCEAGLSCVFLNTEDQ